MNKILKNVNTKLDTELKEMESKLERSVKACIEQMVSKSLEDFKSKSSKNWKCTCRAKC